MPINSMKKKHEIYYPLNCLVMLNINGENYICKIKHAGENLLHVKDVYKRFIKKDFYEDVFIYSDFYFDRSKILGHTKLEDRSVDSDIKTSQNKILCFNRRN